MLLYRFDRARAVKSSRTPLLCGYYGLLANRVFLVCGHSLPHINTCAYCIIIIIDASS
uniref:Uncharacterized protein n=1 Tax=Daphnia magna TaxID=35525 RepID=A0A0P5XNC7_9CRUS